MHFNLSVLKCIVTSLTRHLLRPGLSWTIHAPKTKKQTKKKKHVRKKLEPIIENFRRDPHAIVGKTT